MFREGILFPKGHRKTRVKAFSGIVLALVLIGRLPLAFNVAQATGESHDVAVTSVVPSKTVVGQGYCLSINVTVENQGNFAETFDITAYYGNGTLTFGQWETFWSMGDATRDGYINIDDLIIIIPLIDNNYYDPDYDFNQDGVVNGFDMLILKYHYGLNIWTYFGILGGSIRDQPVSLSSGSFITFVFAWNTTGVPYGNYTISAKATRVPGETDIADNILDDGTVIITIAGDINGDGKVDVNDLVMFAGPYGSENGQPAYNPNCDLNDDNLIAVDDLTIMSKNYGKYL